MYWNNFVRYAPNLWFLFIYKIITNSEANLKISWKLAAIKIREIWKFHVRSVPTDLCILQNCKLLTWLNDSQIIYAYHQFQILYIIITLSTAYHMFQRLFLNLTNLLSKNLHSFYLEPPGIHSTPSAHLKTILRTSS